MKSKTEAKKSAKAYSFNDEYKDTEIYIIYCNQSRQYYVDTNSLIRNWEQITGCYINGVYKKQ